MTPAQHNLRRSYVWWMWWLLFVAVTDAWAFLHNPEMVRTSAYEWAFNFAPVWVFGLAWVGASVSYVLSMYGPKPWRNDAARVGLFLHSTASIFIAISIFWLTTNGVYSAIAGATKWATIVVGSIILLMNPSPRLENRELDHEPG